VRPRQQPTNMAQNHGLSKDKFDTLPINESPLLNAEQFEYDSIEAPQKFPSDLYVDWRIFNLVLWSKCYCRYDQSSMPTLSEQELLSEISSLQERIENVRKKSRPQMPIDGFHSVRISNSIHLFSTDFI